MPTAYLKKLAKLNNTSVDKLEKFWSQAKEIAKSEGQGKSWGLITTIFQNKLKKEGFKVKAFFTTTADTDELDDADLGINVDHKEYHKQKSLQMSLQSKLDMIKKDINKETDDYNKELVSIAKRLNEENRKRFSQDNHGDKWLNYKGNVTKEVLLEAFKDGVKCRLGFGNISDDDIKEELDFFKRTIYPRFAKLLKGSSLRVYRGLDFFDLISKDKEHELNEYLKYLKYNLMDRNSWSTSIETAKMYINYKFAGIILRMNCTLGDANLPLSAWLEGYWYDNGGNEEINLKKSFKVNDIKCVFVGSSLEKLFDMNKFNSTKTLAFYEPDVLDSTTENKLDYIGKVKECIKRIWARGINQEQTSKEWSNNYGNLISDCFYKNIEPKVCARMCYIKYHKENPYTKHLNKDNDVSFDKLLSEANKYFNHLKELKNNSIITSSMKSFDKVGNDGTKYSFEKLTSVKEVIELLKGITIIDDYFNENDEYFRRRYGVSKKEATLGDVGWDEDIVIYIKYNNGKDWYSVDTESKLNDLKLSGIKDAIFEWNGGSVTSYYGKDCRIEKYDEDEDSPWVVKCSKGEIMSKFNKVTSKYNVYLYNGRVVTASNKYELLKEKANTKKLIDKIKEDTWDDIEV